MCVVEEDCVVDGIEASAERVRRKELKRRLVRHTYN